MVWNYLANILKPHANWNVKLKWQLKNVDAYHGIIPSYQRDIYYKYVKDGEDTVSRAFLKIPIKGLIIVDIAYLTASLRGTLSENNQYVLKIIIIFHE